MGGAAWRSHRFGARDPVEDLVIPGQEEPSGHHAGPEIGTQRRECWSPIKRVL